VIDAADEAVHAPTGPGFGESVTFAWGDAGAHLFGSARLGLVAGEPPSASGLALLFGGSEVAGAQAAGAEPAPDPDWSELSASGVRTRTLEPLRRWTVAWEDEGGNGFDLRFEALASPLELTGAAAESAGLSGYEQLCAVQVRARGERVTISCLGQRGHQWGAPDWDRIELARTVSAWLDPDSAVVLAAVRPARAKGHEAEAASAFLVDSVVDEGENEVTRVREVGEPRLSTVYDGEGRQRRAGLELWVGEEDEFPRRVAGEALCGTSIELGRLRLDAAFFAWRMEGRSGVGRYDVLRRA
jgi:hypothetical protein